ncbi:MAG TPA: cyclase family protein [Gemmatimonadales bacterium]|nr:cyclase family protein [Gemmatimonadales bacterium]
MTFYDLSPRLSHRTGVWPGDHPLAREVLLDLGRGDPVTLSTLRATVHLGAHADAPSHYGTGAPSIEQRDLSLYLGPCQVIHVPAERGSRVTAAQLPVPIRAERVLIATGTFPDADRWNDDFAALSPDLVDALAAAGVRLVGIDTPSVDLLDSKELPSHQAVLRHDMAILEGLVLAGVPAGLYELIALPLALQGFDASPVRAVLRDLRLPPAGIDR